MTFGKKLKYLREMHEWTLEEVANLYNKKFDANISKGAISRYESVPYSLRLSQINY